MADISEIDGHVGRDVTVTEIELMELAEKIDVDDWRKLGLWLGIREAALSKYERENWFSGAASIGTYKMLCDWRKNCVDAEQRNALAIALQRCELRHLAKEVLKTAPKGLFGPEIVPIRNRLISFAKTKLLRVPLIPWAKSSYIQVDAIFISVQLILYITGPDIPVRYPLDSYNDILTEEVSDSSWNLPTNRYIVRGKAGSGKTTLLIKLLSDWCRQVAGSLLAKFKLVFFLPMRKLTFQSNLGDAVVKHCLPRDAKISAEAVEQICHENAPDVCILFDGYDEFSGKGLEGDDAGSIVAMLRNEEFIDVHVIVTTRPGRLDDFLEFGDFKHLEVTGFTQKHVHEYIDKTFTGARKEIGTNLYAYLDGNNLLSEVSSVPLLLCAFCQVAKWTDGIDFGKMATYTALFQRLVRCFFEHELAKPKAAVSPESSPVVEKESPDFQITEEFLFDQLGKMALLGFFREKDGELLFSKEDFEKCCKSPAAVIEQGCVAGLLTKDDDISMSPWEESETRNISFVLKTFQEMFAGRYMARLVEMGQVEFFRQYLSMVTSVQRVSDLANPLMFACGQSLDVAEEIIIHVVNLIVVEGAEALGKFWSGHLPIQDCRKVQQDIEFCLSLNYESQCEGKFNKHLQPLFRAIRLFSPPQRTSRTLGYLLKYSNGCQTADASSLDVHSTGTHVTNESDNVEEIDGSCVSTNGRSASVDEPDMVDNKLHVDALEIIHVNKMFGDQFRQIRDFLPQVKKDFLQNVNNLAVLQAESWSKIRTRVTEKRPDDFEDIDHLSDNQFVAYLPVREELKKWQVNEIYLDDVLSGLQECPVMTLVITGIARQCSKWKDLFNSMASPEWSKLVKLDLSRNNLTARQMTLMARALHSKPNLAHLDVSGNEIGKSFVSLIPNLPNLRRIYLTSEQMEPETLAEFGDRLRGFPQIDLIDLNHNPLDDVAAAEIGDALGGCTHLKRLRLDVSGVSDGGITRLVSKIKNVPSLTHLGLYKHHDADELIKSVTSALAKLEKIVSLSLTARVDEGMSTDGPVRLTTTQAFSRVLTKLRHVQVVELFNVKICSRGLLELLRAMEGIATLKEFRVECSCLPEGLESEEVYKKAQQTFLKVF